MNSVYRFLNIFCNVSLMTLESVRCVKYFRRASRYVESFGSIRLFLRFCKLCKSHSKAFLSTLLYLLFTVVFLYDDVNKDVNDDDDNEDVNTFL